MAVLTSMFCFNFFQVFVPAVIAAEAMHLMVVLDPDVALFVNIGTADGIFDHNAVSSHFFMLFTYVLDFLFFVVGQKLKKNKTHGNQNKNFEHLTSLKFWFRFESELFYGSNPCLLWFARPPERGALLSSGRFYCRSPCSLLQTEHHLWLPRQGRRIQAGFV